MTFDIKNIKKHSTTRPRDIAWDNWKSWKDAPIGDGVEGFVADAFFRPEELNDDKSIAFRSQRGITIKQEDGTLINVGVKDLSFVLAGTDNLRVGDPIRIELEKIAPSQKKGQNGAKVFSFYGTNIPESEGNKTVKELTDEDRLAGGSEAPKPEEEEEDPLAPEGKF